ncbi:MAG: PAS domain S-box protein [Candidatus Aminicenantes bacterium]|nr:MAG: PAS domain S-box protein [Candidatus Aminicenantes bacterium]
MKKTKILIVEDEALIAKDIEKILLILGYSVSTIITSGRGITSKIIKENPDLILMDIIFQDKVRGIDIARKVRKHKDIPIIYLTAHSEHSIMQKAKITEPYGYLLKPISEKDLEIAVEMALFRHHIEKKYKKKMKRSLLESEDRYRKLVENISEGIVMQNKRSTITYANQRFLDMIGYKEEEVIGKPITKFLAGGLLKKQEVKDAYNPEDVKKLSEISWKRKDGEHVFTILSPKPVYNDKGQHKGTVAVLTDITDRRAVEKELHHSRELLRKLSQHLQAVRERESKRIAREIHDELGQQLTALKMDLSWISSHVNPQEERADKFLQKIDSMSGLVDKTIHTVQKISSELRPGLLDDLGLVPAIEWLAQEFEKQTKIPYRMQLFCELVDIDPDCSTAIFRISQEALTNVARHANATMVNISLKQVDSALVLKIKDNGKGIEADEVVAPSSLGLMGMRERARVFGGELSITSKPNKGTTLKVTFPVERIFKQ